MKRKILKKPGTKRGLLCMLKCITNNNNLTQIPEYLVESWIKRSLGSFTILMPHLSLGNPKATWCGLPK